MKDHSCVIIPDLGGFVVNARPAAIDNASSYFMPPSKELLFNAHLVHNDGLLAHALMQEEGVSFEEATKKIASLVASVKTELESKGRVQVGEYGSFVQTEGGYSFRFAEMPVEDATSFGLREFYFPLLEEASEAEASVGASVAVEAEKASVKKKRRSFPSFWVSSVAAVAAMLFLSQPVNNERSMDTANFAPVNLAEVVLPQKSYYWVMDRFSTEDSARAYGDSISAMIGDSTNHFEVLRLDGEFLLATQPSKSLDQACELRQDISTYVQDSLMANSFVLGIYK